MIVYVEKKVLEDPAISGDENFGAITKKFCTFREGMQSSQSTLLWLYGHYIYKKKSVMVLYKRFYCYCLYISQILMTSPIVWTSSSVLGEMGLYCMHLRSSRYSARCSSCSHHFWNRLCVWGFVHLLVWNNNLLVQSFIGQRSTSYGLPLGLPGLLDTFQIWHLPVSGHPNYWR